MNQKIVSFLFFGLVTWCSVIFSSCNDDWTPAHFVEKLRVLAIRAEPPDIAPGQSTRVDALVVDPNDFQRANTLLWLVCDPDPKALDQPKCAKYSTLEDIGEIANGQSLPQGMRTLGISSSDLSDRSFPRIIYSSPENLFAQLPSDDFRRQKGVLAIVLLLAVATPPPTTYPPTQEELQSLLDKVKNKQVDSILSLKRIRISENKALNKNPEILGTAWDDYFWSPGLRPIKLQPEKTYTIAGIAQHSSVERYTEMGPDGQWLEKEETPIFSWFSTVGNLETSRTIYDQPDQSFTVPRIVPENRFGMMYQVLRDGRGGANFASRALFFCDPDRPPSQITLVTPQNGPPGTALRIEGIELERLLDVQIGSGFLAHGHWDPTQNVYIGSVASDMYPGAYPLILRTRSCHPDPLATFTVSQP